MIYMRRETESIEFLHNCVPAHLRVSPPAFPIFARGSVVLPITVEVVDYARFLLDDVSKISARDALHAAVVTTEGLEALYSYDRGFDQIAAIRRIEPEPEPG